MANTFFDTTWQSPGGGGGGSVDSVSGTSNRIAIGGTLVNPIVDISSLYVGQTSITTIGTLTNDLKFTDNLYDIGKNGLTRPRDIFTSRDINSARNITSAGVVTVGNAATPDTGLLLNVNSTVTSDTTAAFYYLTGNPSGAAWTFAGFGANVLAVGSNNGTDLYGGYSNPEFQGTGTLDNMYSFALYMLNSSTGTITNAYGLYVDPFLNSGGGSIVNSYGMYIGDIAVGTNKYAIYTNLGAVRFGGVVTGVSGFVGNLTGNASGSSGSTTGNAATATTLQTSRNINGVGFNGSANITVTADANTLTNTSLNSTVVTSSLTSLGTQGADLKFTDATYDIGKSGATRPRDIFASRNVVVGGSLTVSTITNTGTLTLPTSTDTLTGRATTDTLTNKRVTKRLTATTQSATPTINTDNTDISSITGLAQAITSFTTNLSGTPVNGDMLMIQITDNGTARALTFGASFQATNVALPTTTVISTLLRILFQWNSVASKWDCIATD